MNRDELYLAAIGVVFALLVGVGYGWNNPLPAKTMPLAVVLDFGNGDSYINMSFSQRFYRAVVNASSYHAKVLIIKMDSRGGLGYNTPEGTMSFPLLVGQTIWQYRVDTGNPVYFYVPYLCKPGGWIARTYASYIEGPGYWAFDHTRAQLGNATYDWAMGDVSPHPYQYIGALGTGATYPADPWSSFLKQFSDYQIKVIQA